MYVTEQVTNLLYHAPVRSHCVLLRQFHKSFSQVICVSTTNFFCLFSLCFYNVLILFFFFLNLQAYLIQSSAFLQSFSLSLTLMWLCDGHLSSVCCQTNLQHTLSTKSVAASLHGLSLAEEPNFEQRDRTHFLL